MKRLATAFKIFVLMILHKNISANLRYGKKEVFFEDGSFAETTDFLKDLQKRNNFPDYVLTQYKDVLTDYNYKD